MKQIGRILGAAQLRKLATFAALASVVSANAYCTTPNGGRAVAKKPLPNIVIILVDDLGYGDLGSYNSGSKIPTPNLDRMAAQGVRFTDAHAPASVCSPTRYSLLTGRYAWRSPLKRGVVVPFGEPIISRDRLTLPSLLQRNGYTTCAIGKWHLGMHWPTKDGAPASTNSGPLSNVDFTRPIEDGPTSRGFDKFFGTDAPNFPPYCFIENDRTVGIPTVPATGSIGPFGIPGATIPGWKLVDILPSLTRRAVTWVSDAAKSRKPFFLYLPLTSPHYPVVPAPEFKGKSKAGEYGDFVNQTDWTVGQVLKALDKSGVADNTLVIFTSDNGPEVTGEVNPGVYDRIQKYAHYSMGPLRGAKRDLWEGGHRVPFMVRWPGRIRPASVSNATVSHTDIMATVAEMLGTDLPPNAAEDSFSMLPELLGQKPTRPVRDAVVHHGISGKFAIRRGDWVLVDSPTGDENGNQGEPQWLREERGYKIDGESSQLFNLFEDPMERSNRAADRPVLARQLKELLEKIKRNGRSNPGPPQENDPPQTGPGGKGSD